MKTKIKRSELFELFEGLNQLGNLSGIKFAYAVGKNKKAIRAEIQSLQDAIKPPGKFLEYDKKRVELCVKYCDKDEKNNPIIVNNTYQNVNNNPKFKSDLAKLQETYKNVIDTQKKRVEEYNIMLGEEIEFELCTTPLDAVPMNITGNQLEKIILIIEENK